MGFQPMDMARMAMPQVAGGDTRATELKLRHYDTIQIVAFARDSG